MVSHWQAFQLRRKIAEYCKKHSMQEACSHFGVSSSQVNRACRENGVMLTGRRPDRLGLVADLLNSTAAYSTLARKHGISRQAVAQFALRCRKKGLKVRAR